MKNKYSYYLGYIVDYIDGKTDEPKPEFGLYGLGKNGEAKKLLKTSLPKSENHGFLCSQDKFTFYLNHYSGGDYVLPRTTIHSAEQDIKTGKIKPFSKVGASFIPFYASDPDTALLIFELEILNKLRADFYGESNHPIEEND